MVFANTYTIFLLLVLLLLLNGVVPDQDHDYIRRVPVEDTPRQRDLTGGGNVLLAGQESKWDVFVVGLGWAGVGALHQLNRFQQYLKNKHNEDFCFMAADKGPVIGGRANIARVISGRKGNPLMRMLRKYYYRGSVPKPNKDPLDWSTVDWADAQGYDKEGKPLAKRTVRKADKLFGDVFDCVESLKSSFPFTESDSAEDVLNFCGSTQTPHSTGYNGNYSNAITSWDFELETLMPTDIASAVNYPLSAYIDFSPHDVFIPVDGNPLSGQPANGAAIADKFIRDELTEAIFSNPSIIMFNTEVTGIDYTCGDDGSSPEDSFCVKVTTVKECLSALEGCPLPKIFHVKKVIFTGSAGVLNAYGDDAYGEVSIFKPKIPPKKMKALRKIFFVKRDDGNYRRTMSHYNELTVQVSQDVLDKVKRDLLDYNFFFFETNDARRGHGMVWQSMDRGEGEFYPGSRAFVGEIGASIMDEDTTGIVKPLSKPNKPGYYNEKEIRWMVKNTLGKLLKLNDCQRVGPGPISFTPPLTIDETVDENGDTPDCIFHMFEGSSPPYGLWEGAWSVLIKSSDTQANNGEDAWTVERDYVGNLKLPLTEGNDPMKPKAIFFAGEHMCFNYIGYQQGGYLSGLEETLNVIKHCWSDRFTGYINSYQYKTQGIEPKQKFFCKT